MFFFWGGAHISFLHRAQGLEMLRRSLPFSPTMAGRSRSRSRSHPIHKADEGAASHLIRSRGRCIVIRPMRGINFLLEVAASDTLDNVKDKIQAKNRTPFQEPLASILSVLCFFCVL